VSLLLLERAKPGDPLFNVSPSGPDEQYRFHFDMTKCIGCRCCEVACAEQNGNPFEINWRRVGEIEGGVYPAAQRFYLSMGCNHCLNPACLNGCPVNAYTKDSATGLVLHSAEACIGCSYCTWNCPYGVPQFNAERGVVGKCDMCHGRLMQGRQPACVAACPEEAIQIELVNIAEWRRDFEAANAPGLPSASYTISTTRVTVPERIPVELNRADYHRVRPEDPHLPLVFMLVLTQLSVGALLYLSLPGAGQRQAHSLGQAMALAVAFLSLAASTLHLGRPIFAWRALRMWRRSWLSREVLLFSLFSAAAAGSVLVPALSAVAAVLGLAGITASAFIYLVPARPAWNSKTTVADFYLTALLLGPLALVALGVRISPSAICLAASAQLLNQVVRFALLSVPSLSSAVSDEFELRASARLLVRDLRGAFFARLALLIAGGVALPLLHQPVAAFVLALAGELLSRYLFFVSVVPKNMASGFFHREAA
jgi:formate dehydrogenase iron-sulfur subunit